MNHEEIRESLEAYVLGALDADEMAVVDEHVLTCSSCLRLVAAHQETLGLLTDTLAAVSPAGPGEPARAAVLAAVVPKAPRVRRLLLAAAVAVVGVVVTTLGLWSVHLTRSLADERELTKHLSGQQELVFEVIDSPKATKVVLTPPVTGSTAYGKVFTRPDLPFAVVMAARLAPPPSGQEYHVWLTRGDDAILAGTLPVDDEGFGALVFDAGANGPTFDAARVTLQRRGATVPDAIPVLIWSR